MKKMIVFALVCITVAGMLCGCNRQVFDLTYNYNYAVVGLPNGDVIEGNVSSWCDYENSDQIQVVIDGTTYLVHSSNVALIDN
jgi:hypothetical protein